MTGHKHSPSYDHYATHYRVLYLLPALPLIDFPETCPQIVKDRIADASAILYRDPSSAANRIRVAIEELLTLQRANRYPSRSRKRPLTTHARIELFAAKNPDAAKMLMAVKWIGNSGSHDSGLRVEDVLDGVELLSHAINLIYDRRVRELDKRAAKINAQRGVRRPRSKTFPAPPF
ncbi:DUF4145 domain-containing protein [Actinoallomurus acanthiterrae]